MSDPRISPAPYPFERFGGKDPAFEVGSHLLVEKREVLAQVVSDGGASTAPCTVLMSVPDARLVATLSIVFEPVVTADLGEDARSLVRLMSTKDTGSGEPRPVEDLLGDVTTPVRLRAAGLLGFTYSPTEEVTGLRADLTLAAPLAGMVNTGLGKWYALAQWQALRPMSEIDWRDAVSKMVLLAQPRMSLLAVYAPG